MDVLGQLFIQYGPTVLVAFALYFINRGLQGRVTSLEKANDHLHEELEKKQQQIDLFEDQIASLEKNLESAEAKLRDREHVSDQRAKEIEKLKERMGKMATDFRQTKLLYQAERRHVGTLDNVNKQIQEQNEKLIRRNTELESEKARLEGVIRDMDTNFDKRIKEMQAQIDMLRKELEEQKHVADRLPEGQ